MSSSERRELDTIKYLDDDAIEQFYRDKGRQVPPWANKGTKRKLVGQQASAHVLARVCELVGESGVHPEELAEISRDFRRFIQAAADANKLPTNAPKPLAELEALYLAAQAKFDLIQEDVFTAWDAMKEQASE